MSENIRKSARKFRPGDHGQGWKPGQSGNPGGRPKGFAGLAAVIRKKTNDGEELVDFALGVLRNKKASIGDRLEALEWLSVRGFGQPVQPVQLSGDENGPPIRIETVRERFAREFSSDNLGET